MKLHEDKQLFQDLSALTSEYVGIPIDAVICDYFIVETLNNLSNSPYHECCVFKGGTSLSKCYPQSINRFSEDIDITVLDDNSLGKKQFKSLLKNIECTMSQGSRIEKISAERNDRNTSANLYFDTGFTTSPRIKLEIGSSVRPDPYSKKPIRSYIHEYLLVHSLVDIIREYTLVGIELNTLHIERTFLDKVMAIKRHALCGTLSTKVRHIYDVTALYPLEDIQHFLQDMAQLKNLLNITKNTDMHYLSKRNIPLSYNPAAAYDFNSWKYLLDDEIKKRYESLHIDLLYTDTPQCFSDAMDTLVAINQLFIRIDE